MVVLSKFKVMSEIIFSSFCLIWLKVVRGEKIGTISNKFLLLRDDILLYFGYKEI